MMTTQTVTTPRGRSTERKSPITTRQCSKSPKSSTTAADTSLSPSKESSSPSKLLNFIDKAHDFIQKQKRKTPETSPEGPFKDSKQHKGLKLTG